MKQLPLNVGRLATAGLLCALCATAAPAYAQAVKGTKGAIMTKEELRACLAQKDAVDKRRAEIVSQNEQLKSQRDALQQTGATLSADGAQIQQRNAAIRSLSQRFNDHQAKVADWNARAGKVKDAPAAEQEKLIAALNAERVQLQQGFDALKAEQAQITVGYNEQVAAYNQRAQAHAAEVEGLNSRATQLSGDSEAEARDRDAWRNACADRRYREDDEIAIKRGK